LIGSGLMVKAFWKLQEVHAGIDPANVLTMRLAPPPSSYANGAAVVNFYQRLLERVNALPGIASAAVVGSLPPERPINANTTPIEGFVPKPGEFAIPTIDYYNSVSGRYFETVGAR